ncbi:MAG: hypothetical protein WC516_05595 [Patescibacteria group bacterium]|jgi:hypothetical protein
MTFTKGISETPSILEATFIAGILDEVGFYKDASLMDEFIKQASQYKKDLIKQAGLWSGIWNRLSGLTKRLFFKEYRQLYAKAKESHTKITERFEAAENSFKEAKKQIKNYDLVGWRETVLSLPVYTKDLMADYEMAFGRLIAFTYKLQDKEHIPTEEFDINNITPPGEGGEGKTLGEVGGKPIENKRELNTNTRFFKEKGWSWSDPTTKSIAKNNLTDEIAINKEKFNKMKQIHIIDASPDPNKDYVKLAKHDKGFPKGLKEAMGNSIWKISSVDSDWIYLSKIEEEVKEITPQEEVKEEIGIPFLPHIGFEPSGKLEIVEPKKPAREVSEVEVEEAAKEHPLIKNEEEKKNYNKMMKTIKDKVWISYRHGSGKGRFRLINQNDMVPGQTLVSDQKLISKLNDALFLQNYKGKRRVKVFRVPNEADDITKAEFINKILFKK